MTGLQIIDEQLLANSKVKIQTILGEKYIRDYTYKIILPIISDIELMARYKLIKPLLREGELYYHLRHYTVQEMIHRSFLWNALEDKRGLSDLNNAETIAEFPCYHPASYHGLFKPTVAEVLGQFPEEALEKADAFYIHETPELLDPESRIVKAKCYQSRVRALVLKK